MYIFVESNVTMPAVVNDTLLITNVDVEEVPTSPSILNVPALPKQFVPKVSSLAHPAVPVLLAVPVNPVVAKPIVPEVAPSVPAGCPQPILIMVQSNVPDVPESAEVGCEPVYILIVVVPAVPRVPAITCTMPELITVFFKALLNLVAIIRLLLFMKQVQLN
jgi:hypothetical protein